MKGITMTGDACVVIDGVKYEPDEKDREIERLRKALHYEANRFSRIGTHHPDCWKWGPQHYECALRKIKEIKDMVENWSEHD